MFTHFAISIWICFCFRARKNVIHIFISKKQNASSATFVYEQISAIKFTSLER